MPENLEKITYCTLEGRNLHTEILQTNRQLRYKIWKQRRRMQGLRACEIA